MVVVLEGGYNTDYLGQHASGVIKALQDVEPEDYGPPTQADKDAGFESVEDINGEAAEEYAKQDVSETKRHHAKYWDLGLTEQKSFAQITDQLETLIEKFEKTGINTEEATALK